MTRLKEMFKRARLAYRKNPPDAVRKGLTDRKGKPLDTREFIRGRHNPSFGKLIVKDPPFDFSNMKCPSCHRQMSSITTFSEDKVRGYCYSCDAVIWMATSSYDEFVRKRARERYLKELKERINPSRRDNKIRRKNFGK